VDLLIIVGNRGISLVNFWWLYHIVSVRGSIKRDISIIRRCSSLLPLISPYLGQNHHHVFLQLVLPLVFHALSVEERLFHFHFHLHVACSVFYFFSHFQAKQLQTYPYLSCVREHHEDVSFRLTFFYPFWIFSSLISIFVACRFLKAAASE